MVAIGVSSAAMIVIFSVFNGLESLAKERYKAFYPDVKISVAKGKFFPLSTARMDSLKHIEGVINVTGVLEDNVLVISNNQQIALTLKGIADNYFDVNDVRQYIVGEKKVSAGIPYTAIVGARISSQLGVDVSNAFSSIDLYYLNTKMTNPVNDPTEAYRSLKVRPVGIYSVDEEFDGKYILAPLPLVQSLFQEADHYSSVEISAEPDAVPGIKKQLQQMLGSGYKVQNRFEQNSTMYTVMSGEKWAVEAILLLVMIIATFNMVGALSMLVMEKQKDIAILQVMGAQPGTIRKIFFLEGVLWSLIGGVSGILFGVLLCFIQQRFGIVKFGGNFLVDAYPVEMKLGDISVVLCMIIAVGLLVSWYPAMKATRAVDPTLKSA